MKKSGRISTRKSPAVKLEWRNGRIGSTMLGIEDHGMLTYFLHIEGEGWGQGFGGRCCDGAFLAESVRKILETLEVDTWEELKGKFVRVLGDDNKLHRIAHITKNKWYDLVEHANQPRWRLKE